MRPIIEPTERHLIPVSNDYGAAAQHRGPNKTGQGSLTGLHQFLNYRSPDQGELLRSYHPFGIALRDNSSWQGVSRQCESPCFPEFLGAFLHRGRRFRRALPASLGDKSLPRCR